MGSDEKRAVPGLPGYSASADGSIWRGDQRQNLTLNRRLGYLVFNGGGKTRYAHRCVCLAFHGPAPEGCEVRHLDGCSTRNRASNLAWGTRKENVADARRHGTFCRGEGMPHSKLTEEIVRQILAPEYHRGLYREISDALGVPERRVANIRKGDAWAHVPGKRDEFDARRVPKTPKPG